MDIRHGKPETHKHQIVRKENDAHYQHLKAARDALNSVELEHERLRTLQRQNSGESKNSVNNEEKAQKVAEEMVQQAVDCNKDLISIEEKLTNMLSESIQPV